MKEMTHVERMNAAVANEKVDRLTTYPIALAVFRRLVGDGTYTYKDWCTNPKVFGRAFYEGQKRLGLDLTVALMDLAISASDLGAEVKMEEENTPYVTGHTVHSIEDYEKFEVIDITKGRTSNLIESQTELCNLLKGEVINFAHVEGPLLMLSQTAGAERVFMDMFTDSAPVHRALGVMTEIATDVVDAMAQTGVEGICWNYLWGNYSVLGDNEYNEFEAKYAKGLIQRTHDNGMTFGIHNCADLPHLDTQIKKYKPAVYSMSHYPLIEGSPDAAKVIGDGYTDDCLVCGHIDPQLFVRGTVEQVTEATKDLCLMAKTALCKRGLNSSYCISTNCEVPPGVTTKMENLEAMVEASKKYGRMDDVN